MKNAIVSLIFVITTIVSLAQDQVNKESSVHLTFKGVPIDGTLINEPTVRVVASLIAITTALGIYFQSPFIFLFLA